MVDKEKQITVWSWFLSNSKPLHCSK